MVLVLLLAGCAGSKKNLEPIYFPPAPDLPRVQYLTGFVSELDVLPESKRRLALALGNTAPLTFKKATDVAFYGHMLYVIDSGMQALWRFDLQQRKARVLQGFDIAGEEATFSLRKPIGLTIDEQGRKFIADSGLRTVIVLDKDEKYLRSYDFPEGFRPGGMVAAGGNLWVGDLFHRRIYRLDIASGEILQTVGTKEGELYWPYSLALDSAGNLIVSDMGLFRVLKFSPRGKLLGQIGQVGDRPGQFTRPKGIVVSPDGLLHVVDSGFGNVQVFDRNDRLLMFYPGTSPPASLFLPMGIAVSADIVADLQEFIAPGFKASYVVAIANQFGPSRVNLYAFGVREGADYSKYGLSAEKKKPQ
ncbi:hypothetical protein C2E25_16075 [Geothermobacter hydrogeniphilus]|uniref:NHL repeat-containing protein n=1 Tax=Geothermobacter hydrogeniphilus TaxID=1969733 RepID=A0A2K2H658_9BACT|nr:hypothetical protein C2E25_16075 [Geothermobacter hydrogeniphilus]